MNETLNRIRSIVRAAIDGLREVEKGTTHIGTRRIGRWLAWTGIVLAVVGVTVIVVTQRNDAEATQ